MTEIRHGLDDANLTVTGHVLGRIRFEQSRSMLDADGLTDLGITQFRAVTHQA